MVGSLPKTLTEAVTTHGKFLQMWLILPAFCAVSINVRCGMATEDPFAPIRNELRGALAAYSTEAAQMRNILLTFEQSPRNNALLLRPGKRLSMPQEKGSNARRRSMRRETYSAIWDRARLTDTAISARGDFGVACKDADYSSATLQLLRDDGGSGVDPETFFGCAAGTSCPRGEGRRCHSQMAGW